MAFLSYDFEDIKLEADLIRPTRFYIIKGETYMCIKDYENTFKCGRVYKSEMNKYLTSDKDTWFGFAESIFPQHFIRVEKRGKMLYIKHG